jgi:hypothetical protein
MLSRYDLAAVAVSCADAVAAVMTLVNLASSFLALRAHVLPKFFCVFPKKGRRRIKRRS